MNEVMEEGKEYSILSVGDWGALTIRPGQVLEVFLPSTTLDDPPDARACFIAMETALCAHGGWDVKAKHIACGDAATALKLSSMFNRRAGWLHICGEGACPVVDDYALHVQELRLWSVAGLAVPYMSGHQQRQLKRWHATVTGQAVVEESPGISEAPAAEASAVLPKEKKAKKRKPDKEKAASGPRKSALKVPPADGAVSTAPGNGPRVTFAVSGDARAPDGDGAGSPANAAALRERLARAKERLSSPGEPPAVAGQVKAVPPAEDHFVPSS